MKTRSTGPQAGFEEALLNTVAGLPPHRAAQVLDFARWMRTQADADEQSAEDITPQELAAEDAAWDQVYLENRDMFRAMAREALEEYEAGETETMAIEDGKLSAR